MHVGGFTRHPSSGVSLERRGTYAGLIDKIPYLKDLGVSAVELLPVHDAQDLSNQEYMTIVSGVVGLSDLVASKRSEEWLDQIVARSGRFGPPEQIGKLKAGDRWRGFR